MRAGLYFPPKDEPLRDDVRRLGTLVGVILREQGGEELFDLVEAARRAAIERRESGSDASILPSDLDVELAGDLIRAFALYFQVINLAEKTHRVRRRREYQKDPETPQRGSFHELIRRLSGRGVTLDEVLAMLPGLSIQPVFTAHPTEATRRAILEKQRNAARRMIERFDFAATRGELRVNEAQIRAEITGIWQTEAQPPRRPTVLDELDHVLYYLRDVIYAIVPHFYEELETTLVDVYGDEASECAVPSFLRFASWVGGDMDGNPNVSAETLRVALRRQRDLLLARYLDEIRALARTLTQSVSRVEVEAAVLELRGSYGARFPEVEEGFSARESDMPYRLLLGLVGARVAATAADDPRGYPGPEELHRDLSLIADSLRRHRGEHAGLFALRRTMRRVDTFGFHLATIDVRQDAGLHREVVGALLEDPEWHGRTPEDRADRLRQALAEDPSPTQGGARARPTLEVFRAIGEAQEKLGSQAIGPYVVSMAQAPDDVLSVLYLARRAGLGGPGGVPLDVAPLFETVPDLQRASNTMAALFADRLYRDHLSSRANRQTVMIGYSDSNKDGGIAASRWALYEAQEALVRSFQDAGVGLTIFHGRGGTISRGGGKTHRAILAAPPGSVAGRLRATEQGEVIDDNYGLRPIATRSLERVSGAVMEATLRPLAAPPADSSWRRVLASVARASRTAYRELVFAEGFEDYFRSATPVDVIERMQIGSRPSSRRPGGGIDSLRAIPWVFSWTQSRHVLPGWYGLGTGLERAIADAGLAPLHEMLVGWPLFATLLDDAEMVLGKADLSIARRYAELAGEQGRQTFGVIRDEFERTVSSILAIKQNDVLLDDDPVLQRAIRLRNPYIDPMSELQIVLLCRWRETERRDDDLLRALRASVRGIAYGLQNTG